MIPIIYKSFVSGFHTGLFSQTGRNLKRPESKFCVNYVKYENVSNLIENVTPNYFSIFSK